MALKAKHIVEEIKGIRCTLVEKGVSSARCNFLKDLLSFNGFEVITDCQNDSAGIEICAIGVTNLVFNPVIAVYNMSLKTPDGRSVSPAYWEQTDPVAVNQYWLESQEVLNPESPWAY
jgi:hypothetical protein